MIGPLRGAFLLIVGFMVVLSSGIQDAIRLILSMDRSLLEIVLLSLRVSGASVLLGAFIGIPLGSLVGLRRFPARDMIVTLLNTFMGLPPVAVGLAVYLMLSRSGPFGVLGLLFTPAAMIIAQTILVTPIIAALTHAAVAGVDPLIRDAAKSLGAGALDQGFALLRESRYAILSGVIAGFGRAIGEVGAVMIVGGNITGSTRTMTTAMVLETGMGNFELALALGMILLMLAFLVNMGLHLLQGRG